MVHLTFMPIKRIIEMNQKRDTKTERDVLYIYINRIREAAVIPGVKREKETEEANTVKHNLLTLYGHV